MNVAAPPFGRAALLPPIVGHYSVAFHSAFPPHFRAMFPRRSTLLIASFASVLVACKAKTTGPAPLPTAAVTRGDIAVRVQATGSVEPINPVDIKSNAQGMMLEMPVEVGTRVEKGALIAQMVHRGEKNDYEQDKA